MKHIRLLKNCSIWIIACCALLSSCATTSYIGDRFSPTDNIDVYYAAKDIHQGYKVIGHISAPSTAAGNYSKNRIVEKAKAVGANGVIIHSREYTGGKDSTPFDKADAIQYLK